MKKVIAIVGPTASGKSSLALELAGRHNGEIVCRKIKKSFVSALLETVYKINATAL